jgi:uncharacterized repeat protein (TIGR03803 family)
LNNCTDGWLPWAGVIQDAKGNLYGTTTGGGSSGDGTVFRVTKSGKETALYSFAKGTQGNYSTSNLLRDSAGNLYGMTQSGGELSCTNGEGYGCGTIFEVDAAGQETVLYSFKGGTDGMFPSGGLIRDAAGNFYGTTLEGGDLTCNQYGCGTVFKLETGGSETVLHAFAGGSDGSGPEGGLVRDSKGNLYGTTTGGGTGLYGTVYKVTPAGEESILHSFSAGNDGSEPMGSLVMDKKGDLYGTTSGNDNSNYGTVFRLDKHGKQTVLWRFQGPPDGRQPQAGVVMDAAGNLYGTTLNGGHATCANGDGSGCGTVFKLTKKGDETVLYRFTGGSDGGFPRAGLFLDPKDNLYGMTPYGGYSNYCNNEGFGCGVLFMITP